MGKKLVMGALLLAALAGCDDKISAVQKEYEVVAIKPPSYMEVDIRDTFSGEVLKGVPIGKYCLGSENLKIGSKWWLVEITYKAGPRITTDVDATPIARVICN